MTELEDRLERFETLTAECELIAKLATDSTKREFYLRLSEQYRQLAVDMRKAIATKAVRTTLEKRFFPELWGLRSHL